MSRSAVSRGLVLLLMGLLAAEWAMGFVVERAYREAIREAQETSRGRYRIEARHFRRGWFTSSAQTVLWLRESAEGAAVEVPLRHEITHGPVPLGMLARGQSPFDVLIAFVDTRYDPSPARLPRIAAALAGRPLLRARARIGFDRSLEVALDSPRFELEDAGLASDGLHGDLSIRPGAGAGSGVVRLGPVRIEEEGARLRLDGGTWRFRVESSRGDRAAGDGPSTISVQATAGAVLLQRGDSQTRIGESEFVFSGLAREGELSSGELTFALGDLEVVPAGGGAASSTRLTGTRWTQVSAPADGPLRSFHGWIGFEDLALDGEHFGPGRLEAELVNFDAAAWDGLRRSMAELEERAMDDQKRARERVALFTEHMPHVFGPSPEVAVSRLEIVGPSGTLRASARIGVDGSDPSSLSNPFMLMASIRGEAELSAPTGMLHRLMDQYLKASVRDQMGSVDPAEVAAAAEFVRAGMLAKLLSDGTLVLDADTYRLHAQLRDGLPILNGQPADPGFLMGVVPGF